MYDVLQKIIAERTTYSRRQAESFIRQGKVMLNGKLAKLGDRGKDDDKIVVWGKELKVAPEKIYLALNKPKGYVCTNRIFKGEQNIFDLVKTKEKLFAVGRLDKDSHGLVLLTNDGELAQKLAHPSFGSEKEYQVTIDQDMNLSKKLIAGVDIKNGDGVVRAKKANYLGENKYAVVLGQGKKRQLRRMFQALQANVLDLKRIKLGTLELGSLKEGKYRELSEDEIRRLKRK